MIAKYIDFDLAVESTCSSTTLANFYQATWCHITMLNLNWDKKLFK